MLPFFFNKNDALHVHLTKCFAHIIVFASSIIKPPGDILIIPSGGCMFTYMVLHVHSYFFILGSNNFIHPCDPDHFYD